MRLFREEEEREGDPMQEEFSSEGLKDPWRGKNLTGYTLTTGEMRMEMTNITGREGKISRKTKQHVVENKTQLFPVFG